MLIKERLVTLRKQRHETKKKVAAQFSIDQSTYGKYELGHRQPSLEILEMLASYFDVNTDYLLGKTDVAESCDTQKKRCEKMADVTEFYDLLIDIGIREPHKVIHPKVKHRLFNLIKNNVNLIIEDNCEQE